MSNQTKQKALITGITGQVGSYLAEYLLNKDYDVYGLDRRKSVDNGKNIEKIRDKITIIEGDITDPSCIDEVVKRGQYNSIYNMAAQSHVKVSFDQPRTTFDINAIGVLNLLEAIRKYSPETRFLQASTSELFGSQAPKQDENTPFMPNSPYAVAKLAAHHLVRMYREAYNLHAVSAIAFNMESPRRGTNFVTRKICEWVKSYKLNNTIAPLELGNLEARRDWQHAEDAVEAMYRIINQDVYKSLYCLKYDGYVDLEDYCFGSGHTWSIREFISFALEAAFNCKFGDRFKFAGYDKDEVCIDKDTGNIIIKVSEKFYRPLEVGLLQCNWSKIFNELGWKPKKDLYDIVKEMVL